MTLRIGGNHRRGNGLCHRAPGHCCHRFQNGRAIEIRRKIACDVAAHHAGIPSADIRRILTVADPASPRQAYWTSKSARLSAYLCQDRAPDSLAHKPAFGTPLPSRQKILFVCSAHGGAYLWGLAAFGQAGVERILEILREETRAAMQQVGAPTIKHLTPAMVRRRLKGLLSAAEGSAQEGLV